MKNLTIEAKDFLFLSDAKAFQRAKRKEGFKTKLVNHLGVSNPYRTVNFWKP